MTEENNKWLVVVNPKASVGKSEKDWPLIKQTLINEGIEFDDVTTEYPRHAIEIVRNAIVEQGYRKFISVGGDGTNNEIINGIPDMNIIETAQANAARILVPLIAQMGYSEENITIAFRKNLTINDIIRRTIER